MRWYNNFMTIGETSQNRHINQSCKSLVKHKKKWHQRSHVKTMLHVLFNWKKDTSKEIEQSTFYQNSFSPMNKAHSTTTNKFRSQNVFLISSCLVSSYIEQGCWLCLFAHMTNNSEIRSCIINLYFSFKKTK